MAAAAVRKLIEELEIATLALVRDAHAGPIPALAERDEALLALAGCSGLRLSDSELARLEAAAQSGAALIERIRAARAGLLHEIQDVAAARRFANALTPAGRLSVVDITA